MIINLNFESEVPIYLQLRNEIVIGIGKGNLFKEKVFLLLDKWLKI